MMSLNSIFLRWSRDPPPLVKYCVRHTWFQWVFIPALGLPSDWWLQSQGRIGWPRGHRSYSCIPGKPRPLVCCKICQRVAVSGVFAESFAAAGKLPWHLQEIRQMYRTFCRFAVTDGNNVKKARQIRAHILCHQYDVLFTQICYVLLLFRCAYRV